MAILPTDIRILFTNYDIITYILNLASCPEHVISIQHRILATFNINQNKSILTACMHLRIDRNFCSDHEEITSIRLYITCSGLRKGVYNLIEVISNEPNK